MRKIFLYFILLSIFINLILVDGTKIIERAPPEQICCGQIGFDKEKLSPNQTINSRNCCSYTINPEACNQCILESKQRIEKANYERNIVLYSSSALAILLGISIIGFFIVKRNSLDWKEFYKLKLSKIILFFVIVITSLFILLLQAMTYDAPINPISFAIVSFFFWPFLLALFFEKLIFTRVDWLQLKDTPFIFVAFIVNLIWVYSIVCILYYLFRGRKQ